ncbi:MAG: ABC transporter permease [Candidatus Heimdallarchaeaceae archaeon]
MKKKKTKRLYSIIAFALVLVAWELAPRLGLVSTLSFPPFLDVMVAFWKSMLDFSLINRSLMSLQVIGIGYGIGIGLAFGIAALGIISDSFWSFIRSVSAILHPLPGVALLPLAILWFGIGTASIIFVIVHSVMWPMLLNTYNGFKNIPKTQLEVAKNMNLSRFQIVFKIMLPSAFGEIITGLKIGWARAWRALVAGEMVFGATGVSGGLGWYIYQKRFFMDTAGVFAGLIMIALLGIIVEYAIFGNIQKYTIEKWGIQTVSL